MQAEEIDEGLAQRRITAAEYHRMGELGIIGPDERVELLDGELIPMPPIGYRHGYAARTMANILCHTLGDRAVIDANGPVALSHFSEPQPDVLVLRPPYGRYRDRLPAPADVLLAVEVAETSRAFDRGRKARAYAAGGIEELWVVDLIDAEVVVHLDPRAGGYADRTIRRRGERIAPTRFPDASISVADFLEAARQADTSR